MKNFRELEKKKHKKHKQLKKAIVKSVTWFDKYVDSELAKGRTFDNIWRSINTMKSSTDPDVKREVLRNKLIKIKNA